MQREVRKRKKWVQLQIPQKLKRATLLDTNSRLPYKEAKNTNTHTHTYTPPHIYIYIGIIPLPHDIMALKVVLRTTPHGRILPQSRKIIARVPSFEHRRGTILSLPEKIPTE